MPGHRTPRAPTLQGVLAAVRPGHVRRLSLSDQQRRSLRDPDGRLALDVVRHLLAARDDSVRPGRPLAAFPLTEATFQAIARKLGRTVGIKRSRRLLQRLAAAALLLPAGSYRQPHTRHGGGYRVRLHR
jgi:hypothetical protein